MSTVDTLMKLGKSYGWAVSDHEDRRSDETLDAMEIAEQEFRSALVAALAPTTTLVGQILVMATLLEQALRVVKNVEAEGSDEGELLQALIDQGEAAIATVLKEHAMQAPQRTESVAHHPV